MNWIKPKTDWKYGDYFNAVDYNRIKNNLLYLHVKINELFPPETDLPDLGTDKVLTDYFYASEFNAFENELEAINNQAYGYDIGAKQTFYPLGKFIGYAERNRIESTCLRLYKMIEQIETQTRRTVFRANGTDFVDSGEEEWQH